LGCGLVWHHLAYHRETNNLGFNVYRSTTRDGEFTKINLALIKGYGTDPTPHDYTFIDETAQMDLIYFYQIEDVDFSGKINRSKIIEVTVGKIIEAKVIEVTVDKPSNINLIPEVTTLMQNYPNPFNPDTWIPFDLADGADVSITIYDAIGSLVRKLELGNLPPGSYISKDQAVHWDGKNDAGEKVSSGIYFYKISAGDFSAVKKMVIMK